MREAPARDVQLRFSADRVTRVLVTSVGVLVVASIVAMLVSHVMGRSAHDVRVAQMFYLDGERNVPTAFSTFLLLTAATLLALAADVERRRGRSTGLWWVMAVGFVTMALDEAWSFHERLTAPVKRMLGGEVELYYAWVIPAILLLVVLTPLLLRFLASLTPPTRLRLLVAGIVYVGATVGIEFLEGWYDERHGDRTLLSGCISTVQESLEMIGVVLFIRALLIHLGENAREVRISFEEPATQEDGVRGPTGLVA